MPKSKIETVSLAAYGLSAVWYAWDGWKAYSAAFDSTPYPFLFEMSSLPQTSFTFLGLLYWITFGLDRSGSPASIVAYIMAGGQVLLFAIQVWIGPMLWAMNNLT
ncbi:MAG: hypothetical protein HZB29_13965 [Nitrospinae bacterium]|nr:hypothetical protein [Nitrospinota bacterium]